MFATEASLKFDIKEEFASQTIRKKPTTTVFLSHNETQTTKLHFLALVGSFLLLKEALTF